VGYLLLLHLYDPTGKWWYGNPEIYTPPSVFRVLADTIDVEATPPDVYGVITYDWDFHVPRLRPPPVSYLVGAAISAMIAQIALRMMQVGRFGY
jgi:hypothetical protein